MVTVNNKIGLLDVEQYERSKNLNGESFMSDTNDPKNHWLLGNTKYDANCFYGNAGYNDLVCSVRSFNIRPVISVSRSIKVISGTGSAINSFVITD